MAHIEDFTTFEPFESERDLRVEYPEIADNPIFKELTTREIRFCWLVGNRTSPHAHMEGEKRVKVSAQMVFGKYPTKTEHRELFEMKISPKIQAGIEEMAKFSPNDRMRALLATQFMYDKLLGLIVLSEEEEGMMDLDDRKKYADLLLKVNNDLPNVLHNLEHGYGIKVKKKANKLEKAQVVANIADVTHQLTGE